MLCSLDPSFNQRDPAWTEFPVRANAEKAHAEKRNVEENFMVELKI
jgi:hypothetical protein